MPGTSSACCEISTEARRDTELRSRHRRLAGNGTSLVSKIIECVYFSGVSIHHPTRFSSVITQPAAPPCLRGESDTCTLPATRPLLPTVHGRGPKFRSAISSATMLTAISGTVTAPIFKPTGVCTCSRRSRTGTRSSSPARTRPSRDVRPGPARATGFVRSWSAP